MDFKMTEKEIKEILKQYKDIPLCIDAKNCELTRLIRQKYELCEPSAVRLTGLPKSKEVKDPTYNKVMELTEQYGREIDRLTMEIKLLTEKKSKIEENINRLLPIEQKLIHLRYIERRKWYIIENILHYSQRQPFYMHNKIIKKLSENWV
jgi:hypothetical protein